MILRLLWVLTELKKYYYFGLFYVLPVRSFRSHISTKISVKVKHTMKVWISINLGVILSTLTHLS